MSALPVAIEEEATVYQESLTERLGRGGLPLAEALRYATQIATCLRDLHMQRLVYGAVSSQLILLNREGAVLRSSGTLAQLGDGRGDVMAFGEVLGEMVRKLEGPVTGQIELSRVAMQCQLETPDMQQVLITLRLLGLCERQNSIANRQLAPVARDVEESRPTWQEPASRWAQIARQWRPVAGFAALAIWGKLTQVR